MSRPQTACFYVFHEDDWRRLALAQGESEELHSGGPH